MEQTKKNEQDILVVRDEKTGEIQVVAGLDRNGIPKRVPARAEHSPDFLRFDRGSDMLDSFFRNFFRQCKEPSRFGFYKIAAEQADKLLEVMKELLKDPVANADLLAPHKVDTSSIEQEVKKEQVITGEQTAVGDQKPNEETSKNETGMNMEQEERGQTVAQENQSDEQKQGHAETVSPSVNAAIDNGQKTHHEENNVQQSVQQDEQQSVRQEAPQKGQAAPGTGNDGGKQEQSSPARKTLIDPASLNVGELKEKYGVDMETLSEKNRNALLNYGKTGLVIVTPTFGGEKMEIQARICFRKDNEGNLKLVPHFVRNAPRLDLEYKGYKFTGEDKKALKETGNLGKAVELADLSTGELKKHYVSIDRLTNEIVSVPADKVRIPSRIGKTDITEEDRKVLLTGQPLRKEIELKDGKRFSPLLQINVEQRGVEFVPGASLKEPKQDVKNGQQPTEGTVKVAMVDGNEQKQGRKPMDENHWLNADGSIRRLNTYFKKPLTEQQKDDYTAGKIIEIREVPEREGSGTYTAYVKFDPVKKRPRSYRQNPDLAQAKEQIPTQENRTQVTVNEQGKTNEATKHIGEPLKPGQVAPATVAQQEKQQSGQEQKAPPRKGKSLKM